MPVALGAQSRDRAWVGQEMLHLTSEVTSEVDGWDAGHSRQEEQAEEMGCSRIAIMCP